jgi:hypothetical protein
VVAETAGVHVELETVAPETLAFGVVAGLSVGWIGGSVLAGESPVESLPLVTVILAVGTALYALRSTE